MEGFIQANGGDVAKTVTNKCTHLISAETGTKKCADAEKKGAIVVDEAWVREQCGGGGGEVDDEMEEEEEEEEEESGETQQVYLECASSSGGKFWEGSVEGSATTVRYGKVGAAGATQVKDHGSSEAAQKYFAKVLKEKTGKGYEEAEAEAPAAPPAKAAKVTKKQPVVVQKMVPSKAAAASSQQAYLECASSSGGKFWEGSVAGSATTVRYGKVGAAGATQVKDHGSSEAAQKYFAKVLKEKTGKGYS